VVCDSVIENVVFGSLLPSALGETVHAALFKMPPGRYLIRYKVDGDWLIDDNQEVRIFSAVICARDIPVRAHGFAYGQILQVVFSLGNEYNSLVVKDPNAPEEEESDDCTWRSVSRL